MYSLMYVAVYKGCTTSAMPSDSWDLRTDLLTAHLLVVFEVPLECMTGMASAVMLHASAESPLHPGKALL